MRTVEDWLALLMNGSDLGAADVLLDDLIYAPKGTARHEDLQVILDFVTAVRLHQEGGRAA